jgi:predicted ferric reductase
VTPQTPAGLGRHSAGPAGRAPRTHRPGPVPSRRFADVFLTVAGLGLGLAIATAYVTQPPGAMDAAGGSVTFMGRLAGFTGAYLMLIMVLLIARLPWLEQSVGQDKLLRWHQRVGPWALWIICAHVIFITLGYAEAARTGVLHQIWVFIDNYPDVLAAMAGFGLLLMAGITSIRYIRRHLKYETWWVVHLYIYLGLGFAFAHQIVTGASFIYHPLIKAIWIVIWAATAGVVLMFRVVLPVYRSLRHQLRVVEVREEARGVFSVICRGRDIDKLAVSGGQFFLWRFLTRDQWWQAHPYSLSALPQPPYLRVTIKAVGDQSAAIRRLRPGTRVAIEGPYGAFTRHFRVTSRVAMIAAGVGITPLRALLEDLPDSTDATVIVRASTRADLVHHNEIAALVARGGGNLHEVVGPRNTVRFDARVLRQLIPDITRRDVYICGPEGFMDYVTESVLRLGVHEDQIHTEVFGF